MLIKRPNRVRHSAKQTWNAPPDVVFPLLCPVRECEWTRGWDPALVLSTSGVAEPDCVFTLPRGDTETVWIVTQHDPDALSLEMIMVTPGVTVGKLEIALEAAPGGATQATIAYTHTALGPDGDAFLEGFTEAWYARFMEEWEEELSHFLATGTKLPIQAPASSP